MKLVDDKRHWWKWLSVHALAVAGVLPAVWLSLPVDWRAAVPDVWLAVLAAVVGGLGVFGRLVKQGRKP